ncbi:hypothetical protein ACG9XR_13100 [Acinetobacter guillouiae]|uniref:hypothetical protein n=2 Tax=Acinetobacter guillouiae TaxID=106649 RepID=UPI003AF4ECBB
MHKLLLLSELLFLILAIKLCPLCCICAYKKMNKTYKISFVLTAVVSAIYYMVKDLQQDNMSIDLGTGVILGIVATLITLVCWLYLRSEEKKYLNKKEDHTKL